jgi:N-acetylglutamate synthase-like GNAT family acetyltransferase
VKKPACQATLRRAIGADEEGLRTLLEELSLVRPSLVVERFWVAEEGGAIVGAAHLEPVGDHLFVSSVGVRRAHERRGIATALLTRMFARSTRRIYLYTVIPAFFERLGFRVAPVPRALPPRELFGCDACERTKCVCMVRVPNVP